MCLYFILVYSLSSAAILFLFNQTYSLQTVTNSQALNVVSGLITTFYNAPMNYNLFSMIIFVRCVLFTKANYVYCNAFLLQAAHEGVGGKYEEMTAWKHFTRRDEHIYVTMSTSQPVVDTYAVFTVRTSIFVPHIYYMVSRSILHVIRIGIRIYVLPGIQRTT